MLLTDLADDKLVIFFLFCLENRIGDNLHEVLGPVF